MIVAKRAEIDKALILGTNNVASWNRTVKRPITERELKLTSSRTKRLKLRRSFPCDFCRLPDFSRLAAGRGNIEGERVGGRGSIYQRDGKDPRPPVASGWWDYYLQATASAADPLVLCCMDLRCAECSCVSLVVCCMLSHEFCCALVVCCLLRCVV